MAMLVADCPRCRATKITFDVNHGVQVGIQHNWLRTWEAFCVCRNCRKATIFVLSITDYEFSKSKYAECPVDFPGSLNPFLRDASRYICIRDIGAMEAPDDVPPNVADAFNQGATCVAVECWDAAAAMFRKSIDLATAPMLPAEDAPGLNARTRRDLGLRLPWLLSRPLISRIER